MLKGKPLSKIHKMTLLIVSLQICAKTMQVRLLIQRASEVEIMLFLHYINHVNIALILIQYFIHTQRLVTCVAFPPYSAPS